MRLRITPTFARAVKKLHPRQKADLDAAAVKLLMVGPHANVYRDHKRVDD